MQKWHSNTKTGLEKSISPLWCSHKNLVGGGGGRGGGGEAGAFGGEASLLPPPLDRTLTVGCSDLATREWTVVMHRATMAKATGK